MDAPQRPEAPPEWMRPLLASLETMLRALWVPEPQPHQAHDLYAVTYSADGFHGFARLGPGNSILVCADHYSDHDAILVRVQISSETVGWRASLSKKGELLLVQSMMIYGVPGRAVDYHLAPSNPGATLAGLLRPLVQKAVKRATDPWRPQVEVWFAEMVSAIREALPLPIADEVVDALKPDGYVTAWDDFAGEAGLFLAFTGGGGWSGGPVSIAKRVHPRAPPLALWEGLHPRCRWERPDSQAPSEVVLLGARTVKSVRLGAPRE